MRMIKERCTYQWSEIESKSSIVSLLSSARILRSTSSCISVHFFARLAGVQRITYSSRGATGSRLCWPASEEDGLNELPGPDATVPGRSLSRLPLR